MTIDNRQHIIIAGGGSAGWMTAAALVQALPRHRHRITLVASSAIPTVAVGEATIPSIHEFNQFLGIDEKAFMRQTRATFKLGIEFTGWSARDATYMHPFGPFGVTIGGVPFHQHYLRALQAGNTVPLSNLNLEWQMAFSGVFTPPIADKRSPLGHVKYAYHFDAIAYADFLKDYSLSRGVTYLDDTFTDIHQHENGAISGLTLANHGLLEGDFFIDCSGFKGRLISETLGADYEDWRDVLPCDSALTCATPAGKLPRPYTRATAHENGWRWEIPLQHRTGNGWVYSSRFCSDENAKAAFADAIGVDQDTEFHALKWVNGMRKTPWLKNCVAIGLSAGFIEPLESTGLQLIQSAIFRLLSLFPCESNNAVRAAHYNRFAEEEMHSIRDFVVSHYALTTRDDSAFWRYCSDMTLPDSLLQRLALYQESGTLYRGSNELFNEISWFAVLHGQGVRPSGLSPLAFALSDEALSEHLNTIGRIFTEVTRPLPAHGDYLNEFLSV